MLKKGSFHPFPSLLLLFALLAPLTSLWAQARLDQSAAPGSTEFWEDSFDAPAPFGEEARNFGLGNARIQAVAKDGRVSIFMQDEERKPMKPFASFAIPEGAKLVQTDYDCACILTQDAIWWLVPDETQNFLAIAVHPRPGKEDRVVSSLRLPEIELSEDYVPSECKALGSAGLTAVDGHAGSYLFLAVANPATRKGVVAAWASSFKGSGIVFSSKTPDGKHVTIQPELQYGRYEIPAKMPQNRMVGDVFVIRAFDDCLDGLEAYADLLTESYEIHMKPQISGYCTWYSNQFGGAGTEESTREFADLAAEKLVPFGMGYFQIDDKWQLGQRINGPAKNFTSHNPEGPYHSGMKPTAEYLNSKGLVAGVWFMPFSGNWNDPYYADKQEWFVKSAIDYPEPGQPNTRRFSNVNQKKGAPYETFWGGTSLDMTDHDVEKYVHEEVDRISNQWGFKYFKYDGMWTAMACEQLYVNDEYLPDDLGKQIFDDSSRTNVEVYRKGLQMVRDAGGEDVFILGCNVSQNMRTMGASIGLVDAMRIGPDNGSNWKGICSGPIRGTARYFFNGRVWFNDPDPVYVRDSIPLSHAQLITSWAAISGQLFAFSDWLPALSEERVNVLQRTIAPARLYSARPLDLFESELAHIWKVTRPESDSDAESGVRPDAAVFGLFNWSETEPLTIDKTFVQVGLDPRATYVGFDFWANTFIPPFRDWLKSELPGGSCRVISLVKLEDHPVLVGTNRHVTSPLFEVTDVAWNAEKRELSGTSTVVGSDPYELRFVLSDGLKPAGVSAEPLEGALSAPAELEASGRTLRVRFTAGTSGKVRWTVRFEAGETLISDAETPKELTAKTGYRKIDLSWAKTPNFGFVLTKIMPDGSKKSWTLSDSAFTDSEVKTSEAYRYELQAVGWNGDLSEAVTVEAVMPKTIVVPPVPPTPEVALTDLKPVRATSGWGSVKTNQSVGGNPLTLNGKVWEKGFGVHANSELVFDVPAGMTRFVAAVGLDDFHKTDPRRSVIVRVWSDVCEMGEPQVLIGESPLLSPETVNVWYFDLPLEGRVKQIRLEVSDADDGIACDHVDWVDAGFRK